MRTRTFAEQKGVRWSAVQPKKVPKGHFLWQTSGRVSVASDIPLSPPGRIDWVLHLVVLI